MRKSEERRGRFSQLAGRNREDSRFAEPASGARRTRDRQDFLAPGPSLPAMRDGSTRSHHAPVERWRRVPMNTPNPRRVLLVDLDGTLTNPAEGIVGSFRFALAVMGRPAPPEADLGWIIGPPLRRTFADM